MIEILNLVVLVLTFGAIVWYSYETRLLRKVSKAQLLASNAPVLGIHSQGDLGKDLSLVLKNLGKGPAFNVVVSTDENLRLEPQRIEILPRNGDVPLRPIWQISGGVEQPLKAFDWAFFRAERDISVKKWSLPIELTCCDSAGHRYVYRNEIICDTSGSEPAVSLVFGGGGPSV